MGAIEKSGLLAAFLCFLYFYTPERGEQTDLPSSPMEEAGSRPAARSSQGNMELPMRELVATREGESSLRVLFPHGGGS